MLRETAKRFNVFVLVLTVLFALVPSARAQSPMEDAIATALKEADLRNVHQVRGRPFPQRRRCNPKRRALIGAAVGAAVGMVAVRRAARDNGGTAGAKGTLHAGGYGAVLGAVVGSATCLRR
jgi:hypothetical protein